MKKFSAVVVLAFCALLGSFALDVAGMPLNVGIGFMIGPEWSKNTIPSGIGAGYTQWAMTDYGFKLYADTPYVQAALGYYGMKYNTKTVYSETLGTTVVSNYTQASAGFLKLQLLGKYPFQIAKAITLSPLAGFDFDFCVAAVDDNGQAIGSVSDFNRIFGDLGVAADFNIGKSLYIRPELILGIRLYNPQAQTDRSNLSSLQTGGIKLDFGISAGYRL